MKKVFVLISDKNYLEHAKSLFFAAKDIGKWDGDLCLIANNVDENLLLDFKKFGVEVIHKKIDNYYYANYFIFDTYMKKWDYLMYMDCDFTIFGDLNNIVSDEIKNKPLISVDKEPFTVKSYLSWGVDSSGQPVSNINTDDRENMFKELSKTYNLDILGFNAGFMEFNTSIIKENTLEDLLELSKKLQPINFHTSKKGSDQPVFNLYFMGNINYIENKKVSFWRESNTNTIAQHHCRWEAPWNNNFFSPKLGKTYLQNYKDNLHNFYVGNNKL